MLVHRVSCLSAGLSLRLSVCHRHAVACFLTRGDLYLSWEEGAKVFDVWLLDSEWALNTCNWLWLSASAFFHTYFRYHHETLFAFGFRLSCLLFRLCRLRISGQLKFSAVRSVYSPVTFGQRHDPEGGYVRRYIPALAKMPKKYIYEPWKAPLSVQKAAGCIVGKDYPKPIVDHGVVSKANIGRIKGACSLGYFKRQAHFRFQ